MHIYSYRHLVNTLPLPRLQCYVQTEEMETETLLLITYCFNDPM